ncbi:MAG: GyrI-like domain-containing protein [Anaerolineae bacterium]|nr:GyrI-like domain-containing protein [Anaerolineae bacterium]
MQKVDLIQPLKSLFNPPAKTPVLVNVPPQSFLMIDGEGAPDSALYQEVVGALYTLAYTLKFAIKKELEIDYKVMALEGLWWMAEGVDFSFDDRANWRWTMMIAQPEWVTPERFERARVEALKKGKSQAARARLETLDEGRAAQIMHIGPYSAEPPTVAKLHAFIAEQGLRPRGKHHEIYLGDPNRSAPEKLKTILRQPVE